MERLDLTELARCRDRLREAVEAFSAEPESVILRDSLVKRFEFTYEIAAKLLRKAVHVILAVPEDPVERLSLPSAVRLAWEHGLLKSSWNVWDRLRRGRNKSAHAYFEPESRDLEDMSKLLLNEVDQLLEKVEAHQRHA